MEKDGKKKETGSSTNFSLGTKRNEPKNEASKPRLCILANILIHMRRRYHNGDQYPLTLEEILEETNQQNIGPSMKKWLAEEALINNIKIQVSSDKTKFVFKPVYDIRDGKSFMRLLKDHDLKGLGGILLDDIYESLPNSKRILKKYANEIIYVTRPSDKKEILFYKDPTANITVDEDIKKFWHMAQVNSMEDCRIERYLKTRGMNCMQSVEIKKQIEKRKRSTKKSKLKKVRGNEHLGDLLEEYEEEDIEKKELSMKNIVVQYKSKAKSLGTQKKERKYSSSSP